MLAALAVWAFVVWRATVAFTPGNHDNSVYFNSDSAIVVLMANDDRPITVFNAYYYGADRWGGWPFLVAQAIRRATGYTWTPHSVFVMQAVWVLLGAWACAALCRRDWAIAGLAYLIAACVLPGGDFLLFELSQIYGWQVTGVLFAWLGIRRVFDSLTRSRIAAARWFVLALIFTFLAVWSSVASLPILMVLCAIEGVRAWAGGADSESPGSSSSATTWRVLAIGSALAVTAVAGGALFERLLKSRYHRWALEHYGSEFSTTFHIDHGHLLDSLGIQAMHLVRQPWSALSLLPIAALIVLAAMFIYALAAGKSALRRAVSRVMADDTAMMAAGSIAIAALSFVLAVLVDHVRLNGYNSRYLTLCFLFLPIAGMLTLYVLSRMAARPASRQALAQPACAALAIVLLAVAIPTPPPFNLFRLQTVTARELAARAPRGVLLGGYWDTYLFAALQPPERALIPVPFEGASRTPWTGAAVKSAREVIVVSPKDHSVRGPSVTMPDTITQYGATLRLDNPHWLENDSYQFGRYINVTATTATPVAP
jgi:hypothetical protein